MVKIIFLLFLPLNLFSQDFFAAPLQSMGNTALASSKLYALDHNAAITPFLKRIQVGVAYQPHFLSNDLRSQALYLGVPYRNSGIGLSMQTYGIPNTSSISKITGSYSRKFGNTISTSVTLNYHGFRVVDVMSDNSYTVDLGFFIKPMNNLNVGAIWNNISRSNYSDLANISIDQMYGVGFNYMFSEDLSVASDLLYSKHLHLIYRAGLDFAIDNLIMLRAGFNSTPMLLTGGIGLVLKAVHVDISTSYHSRIGTSPQIALAYEF